MLVHHHHENKQLKKSTHVDLDPPLELADVRSSHSIYVLVGRHLRRNPWLLLHGPKLSFAHPGWQAHAPSTQFTNYFIRKSHAIPAVTYLHPELGPCEVQLRA